MTASHIDSIIPAIPLKRVGDLDESGYMTGSSLTIDGGMAL
jgi:3-oxoacyl-[acyl-carrier protein] reductase